jgi:hypothetical protein
MPTLEQTVWQVGVVSWMNMEVEVASHFDLGTRVTRHHNHANPGKLSFRVKSRAGDLWVKVAGDEREDKRLRRWADLSTALASDYSAPLVLDTLEVRGRIGLVFPFLLTPVATTVLVRSRLTQILALLDALHGDDALAARLGPALTAGEAFRQLWLRRLRADLEIVQSQVLDSDYSRMATWLDDLASAITGPAFDVPVHAPIHADPWHENLLISDNELWLLDWDGLRIGDPLIDTAIVLHDALGPDIGSWLGFRPKLDRYTEYRLRISLQALVLDQVIDGAADWVQNDDPLIKAGKQRSYQLAMKAYRTQFLA